MLSDTESGKKLSCKHFHSVAFYSVDRGLSACLINEYIYIYIYIYILYVYMIAMQIDNNVDTHL